MAAPVGVSKKNFPSRYGDTNSGTGGCLIGYHTHVCPKRLVDPPSVADRLKQRGRALREWLGRLDRRLRPLVVAGVVLLVAVLAVASTVFADIPGPLWLLIAINPLLFGCALWFLYECLRHLILTRAKSE